MKLNPVDIYLSIFIKMSNKMTIPLTSKTSKDQERAWVINTPPTCASGSKEVLTKPRKKLNGLGTSVF
jgi:hypothetical protein